MNDIQSTISKQQCNLEQLNQLSTLPIQASNNNLSIIGTKSTYSTVPAILCVRQLFNKINTSQLSTSVYESLRQISSNSGQLTIPLNSTGATKIRTVFYFLHSTIIQQNKHVTIVY